jgi:hypothetical protein
MGAKLITRAAVGLSVAIGAGVLALGGTAGADHEPFFDSGDADINQSDAASSIDGFDFNYDAYRLRVTVGALEDWDEADYGILLTGDDGLAGFCSYPEPLDIDDPLQGGEIPPCVPSIETEGGSYAELEAEADAPSTFCVTVVVAAQPDEESSIDYTLTASALDDEGPSITAESIGLDVPCSPEATTMVADPALLDVQLTGIQAPLGAPVGRLTDSDGDPVAGKLVTFTGVNGQPICSAVTDAGGVAACHNLIPVVLGGLAYNATFAGDEYHAASTARGTAVRVLTLSLF